MCGISSNAWEAPLTLMVQHTIGAHSRAPTGAWVRFHTFFSQVSDPTTRTAGLCRALCQAIWFSDFESFHFLHKFLLVIGSRFTFAHHLLLFFKTLRRWSLPQGNLGHCILALEIAFQWQVHILHVNAALCCWYGVKTSTILWLESMWRQRTGDDWHNVVNHLSSWELRFQILRSCRFSFSV